jgi:threonylcarbamoyladenosine tRNA methylthiotransferase MtaB
MDHALITSSLDYKIHTFGCKVNTYDSSLVGQNMQRHGFKAKDSARIHVLNTCAVTAEATKEAVRLARRLKAKDPFCTVVVTGCAAQVDTDSFENLSGIDLVIANSHKSELPFILQRYFSGGISEKVFKSNIFKKEDLEPGGGEENHHTRSFLKIQDGCNSFCTYCVIPFARGKSRSLSVNHLVERVRSLCEQGVNEVVLTGVHIGDYEDDSLKPSLRLEDLLEQILQRTSVPRIRLTSLEPIEISDRLLELYSDDRMCPHFHMSIQSANSEVLGKMKRNYSQVEVRKALQSIHAKLPDVFIGMDVIVGFPTETHEQFEDTYLTLADLPWTRIHVFPYSQRPGTFAARLENRVSEKELHLRALRLRELSFSRYQMRAQSQVGTIKKTLLLKSKNGGLQGLSRDYWPISFSNAAELKHLKAGQEVSARVEALQAANAKGMESPLLAQVMI